MQYASLKKFDESVKITKPTRANQGGGQQKKRRKTEVDEDYDIMVSACAKDDPLISHGLVTNPFFFFLKGENTPAYFAEKQTCCRVGCDH